MRGILGILPLLCGFFWLSPADATVRIQIDLATQTMHVESSRGSYSWAVSTAGAGYVTPSGSFVPTGMERMHYSRKYDLSPMPYSIFFSGGLAIHGTYETAWLGRPVSHGCVRIAPGNAALLYQMVKEEGATITISGTPPRSLYHPRARRAESPYAYGYPPRYYYSPEPDWQPYPYNPYW
jgi:hypothetical protein